MLEEDENDTDKPVQPPEGVGDVSLLSTGISASMSVLSNMVSDTMLVLCLLITFCGS